MIKLVPEPFDSKLWNKKVFRLFSDGPFTKDECAAAIASQRPDIVYATVSFSPEVMETLSAVGFRPISIRSTYALPDDVTVKERKLPDGVRIASLGDGFTASDEDLKEMALAIGPTSRYFNDPRIPREDAIRLYVTWIRNSLVNGYVKEAFMAIHGERLVGLMTVKLKEGMGVIDLVGVLSSFQRIGLGSILLARAVHFLRSNGVKDVSVVTEGENVRANAFYQRNGFLIRDLAMVYHAHPIYG
jgi:ribosomal protein S18 acetylase RimI-like enzyme